MSNADVLIYVHSELSQGDRAKVKQGVEACAGVISADFGKSEHPHALIVEYRSETVQSRQILDIVRRHDPAATMAGM